MSFELKQIPEINFQHVNAFFRNGYDGHSLREKSQKTSLPFVDLQTHEWYFDGIRMSYSDWNYKEPIELQWRYDINVELVTFMANLRGSIFIDAPGEQRFPLMGNYQHNLFYSNSGEADEGILKREGSKASMFFIQFTKDAFLRLTMDANEALAQFSKNVLSGSPAAISPANLSLEAPMQNMINNILHCQYQGGLKKMYLLSKSIEFLVIQAEACNRALVPSYAYIKNRRDKDYMMYAREYITSKLESPPSLSELAKIVGINEYKLKRGFKETFGNTVFGYISDARLDIAKNNLLETNRTVSDISSELGYLSVQHFSNAFKKKFGLSPSHFKKVKP
jgi:AraC family transcriptional regulator, transcriptional activator of the genes for pyochelin and ferripyochelin receptors